MRNRAFVLLTALVLFFGGVVFLAAPHAETTPDPAISGETTVFSKEYAIGWLHLLVAYDSFSHSADETATLRVTRLTPDKDIRGSLLLFNEDWMNGFRDFCRSNDEIYEQEITLRSNKRNSSLLYLRGDKGAKIRIEILVGEEIFVPTASLSASAETLTYGESAELTWSTEHADSVNISPGLGVVDATGTATVSPTRNTVYTLTATGPGGDATASVSIDVQAAVEPQPEESFGQTYEDLIPPDASIGAYDASRFALVTGHITDLNGQPLADVAVTVQGAEALYGTAYTDETGDYSMPLEGGGTVTLRFTKDGFIESQRKSEVSWNDITVLDTVALVPFDTAATTIIPDGNPATVAVHQSTPVTDDAGTRGVTLVFPGDVKAYKVNDDGSETELTSFTVRASEFPTLASMPAMLPPTSAFTWCAEFSVDEADEVQFSAPVAAWIDNFLGFDVGLPVPVGFYDRDKAAWVPVQNGIIVQLLDTDGDGQVDALDATGDGEADDLDGDGILTDEVQGQENATPGATYMRAMLPHFTSFDCNYPAMLPDGAAKPAAGTPPPDCNPCKNSVGSYISHRDQVYHKDVAIPGTDVSLHYASDRAEGYQQTIEIPLSGDSLPEPCKEIKLKVEVAGKVFTRSYAPETNLTETYAWDGLDQYGNPAPNATAHVRVGYVYNAYFAVPADTPFAFAMPGLSPTKVYTRADYTLWSSYEVSMQSNPVNKSDAGNNWTLSTHHSLNPTNPNSLFKGDGGTLETTTAVYELWNLGEHTEGMAVASNGDYYYTNWYLSPSAVMRFNPDKDEAPVIVAGGHEGDELTGLDGPAVEASLPIPGDVALDSDNAVYFLTIAPVYVLKVDNDGILRHVAGTGESGYSGDNGPATDAAIMSDAKIAIDQQGNIYLAEWTSHRVRKIDTNGIITTIAGTGDMWNRYADKLENLNGPALEAHLSYLTDIDIDKYGNIYVSSLSTNAVHKITPDGMTSVVAGVPGESRDAYDGGLATETPLYHPDAITVDDDGLVYVSEIWGTDRVRKVLPDGTITTVMGCAPGTVCETFETGKAATTAKGCYDGPYAMDIAPDGSLAFNTHTFCNVSTGRVKQSNSVRSLLAAGQLLFPDDDGTGHIVAANGRHLRTIDLATGVTLRSFEYDDAGRLIAQVDTFGNRIEIHRAADGTPTAIISPDGIETALTCDATGNLTAITYPEGQVYAFTYDATGLLTAFTDPKGSDYTYTYNEYGHVTDAYDPAGGHWQYEQQRTTQGLLTSVLSAEGQQTTYLDRNAAGALESTITTPDGGVTEYWRSQDELHVHKELSCGTILDVDYALDPEYNQPYVARRVASTESGLASVTESAVTYLDEDGDSTYDLIQRITSLNGKPTTTEDNVAAGAVTVTTPEGRSSTQYYDPATLLPQRATVPGLLETTYGYDARGRLTSVATGERSLSYAYDDKGNLASVTDPLSRVTTFTYDADGRRTGIARPDGSNIDFTYDLNGNLSTITVPGASVHTFGYNAVDYNNLYEAPTEANKAATEYHYYYDLDRRLARVVMPSGREIVNTYGDGVLKSVSTPEGEIEYTYSCSAKVESITRDAESMSFAYDGSLITSVTQSGSLEQSLGFAYNSDFDVAIMDYADISVFYTYDDDGLLIQSGDFTIARDADNGLPLSVQDGDYAQSRTFSEYGEQAGASVTVGGNAAFSWSVERDAAGRITSKQEVLDGVAKLYEYTYDDLGRLTGVTLNGAVVESYAYGENGARSLETNALRGVADKAYTYGEDHRLLSAGATSYTYDADGFLLTKTTGSDVTQYAYASTGELLSVHLPDGRLVEYENDALGRRVVKKIDGQITEYYLWLGRTRLLAVFNADGSLKYRFTYADDRMPVSMTTDGQTYYLAYDQVGSLRAVTDANGTVVKTVSYDSFGNVLEDSNPALDIPFGFVGGLYDADTGLVRFGFRDYDAEVGSWTAKDPIGFNGGDSDLYGYCGGDSVNFIDPSGFSSWKISIKRGPCPEFHKCVDGCIEKYYKKYYFDDALMMSYLSWGSLVTSKTLDFAGSITSGELQRSINVDKTMSKHSPLILHDSKNIVNSVARKTLVKSALSIVSKASGSLALLSTSYVSMAYYYCGVQCAKHIVEYNQ